MAKHYDHRKFLGLPEYRQMVEAIARFGAALDYVEPMPDTAAEFKETLAEIVAGFEFGDSCKGDTGSRLNASCRAGVWWKSPTAVPVRTEPDGRATYWCPEHGYYWCSWGPLTQA